MAFQVVQQIGPILVFDLVIRHQLDVVDIGCRHHNIPRRAIHIFEPFKKPRMLQRDCPDQFSIYLLDNRRTERNLASQTGILAQLLIGKLACQRFIHNGQLVLCNRLDGIGKLSLFRRSKLVAISAIIEKHRRGNTGYEEESPTHA